MSISNSVKHYNRVPKAWANWLKATVELFFSPFISEPILTKADLEMHCELWDTIARVVRTGPGPVDIPTVSDSHVGNKTFYYRIGSQWFLAMPNHEIILIAEPSRNSSNIVGIAKDIDLDFQRRLLADLKFWLEAYWEAKS